MKKLIMVNGTMGVGKTTTCQALLEMLCPSVFLDGDWCWNMNPFSVTEETKAMVMDNITHLLGNYLRCSAYEYVIFCWVMHRESMMREILERLPQGDYRAYGVTLCCTEEALRLRLARDVERRVRREDVVERSVRRMPLYAAMHTHKIDVTGIGPDEAAARIRDLVTADREAKTDD